MASITVKGNRALFEQFGDIHSRMAGLPAIIQNDRTVSEEQLREWVDSVRSTFFELDWWAREVRHHVDETPVV
jgi:hypothetical protein